MDDKDKKIKELEDKLKVTEAEKVVAEKARDEFKVSNEKLGKDIKKKDDIIDQKNKDIIGTRQQYKKMSDRSKEELDLLSDAEKEAITRQENLEKNYETLKKETEERSAKEIGARKAALIKKYVGNNPDLTKKMEENLSKLNPALLEKAITDEDLAPHVDSAYQMLGTLRPDPIKAVLGFNGGEAPIDGETKSFVDTAEGTDLFNKLMPNLVDKTKK